MALRADYDDEADVLYLTYGKPRPGYGDTGPDDITLRYSDDGSPIGATIIGYRALNWPTRRSDLARRLSRHFGVSLRDVLRVLRALR